MAQHCAGVMNYTLYIAHQFQKLKFRAWAFFPPQVLSVYYFFFSQPTSALMVLVRPQEASELVFWVMHWEPLCIKCAPRVAFCPNAFCVTSSSSAWAPGSSRDPQVSHLLRNALHFWILLSGSLRSQCLIPRLCSFLSDTCVDNLPCLWISLTSGLHISDYAQSVAHRPVLPFFPLYFVQALIHLRSVKLKWATATGNWIFNTVIHLLLI